MSFLAGTNANFHPEIKYVGIQRSDKNQVGYGHFSMFKAPSTTEPRTKCALRLCKSKNDPVKWSFGSLKF